MRRQEQGSAVVSVIVGLIVLAAIGIGVMYFTSDVWRTKIDAAADQYAHWTPENIAKDPENYLKFCEAEANKAMLDLKASEISIAQSRGKMIAMQEESKNKIALGEKAFGELKELYAKTDAANAWPAEWQGQKREKDWTQQQIVSFHRQVESQKNLKAKVEDGVKKLDVQANRIQTARAQTQEQLAEIKTSREILKVQKITNELTTRLTNIKGVLQATISTASETTGVITLDQLAAESTTTVDKAEFDKIMGK